MKMIVRMLRFYMVCCLCMLVLVWIDCKYTFNSLEMGYGILIAIFLWAPIYTIFIGIIHFLRINTKILGNVFYEFIVALFPHILNACYFYIAYRLVDNYFVMSPDGNVVSRKWFLDFGNVDIMIYSLLFVLLVIHGQITMRKKHLKGESINERAKGQIEK